MLGLERAFQTDTRLYLLLQYCSGGEFYTMLKRRETKRISEVGRGDADGACFGRQTCVSRPHTPPPSGPSARVQASARFYAAEILLGLEYLHWQGFVYRDLKPENVLLHGSGHVILADFDLSRRVAQPSSRNPSAFGVAQAAPSRCPCWAASTAKAQPVFHVESKANSNINHFQSFVGTTEYIAPEVLDANMGDREGYGMSVDWWTFGILIYEMLYGETPFKGKDDMSTFASILHKTIALPKHIEVRRARWSCG